MDVLEAIWTRRSIRKYQRHPVEFEKLMTVCEAGSLAPSSGNIQNWFFVVVNDQDLIKSLAPACVDQECVYNAPACIVVCGDEDVVERQYGLRGKRLYSIQNCAAAVQNMLLTAHSLGLGATWIGAFNEERLKPILSIPDVSRPQAIITLGYPDETPPEKRMRHIDDVIRHNSHEARYKDVHRVLKDYSVEWEKQARYWKERAEEGGKKIVGRWKEMGKKMQDSVKPKKRKDKKKDKKNRKDK